MRLNAVRKKVGQQPSIRASMLITEEDELMFEQGKINYSAGTESERSSISEGSFVVKSTILFLLKQIKRI